MPADKILLHDIKPLIEIQEYSFYYFLAVVALGVILLLGALYILYHYLKNRNKFNIRKEHLRLLNAISFSNPKQDAYDITLYGATFAEDNERISKAFEALVEHLEVYKYKKDVPTFDTETKHSFERYVGMLDV